MQGIASPSGTAARLLQSHENQRLIQMTERHPLLLENDYLEKMREQRLKIQLLSKDYERKCADLSSKDQLINMVRNQLASLKNIKQIDHEQILFNNMRLQESLNRTHLQNQGLANELRQCQRQLSVNLKQVKQQKKQIEQLSIQNQQLAIALQKVKDASNHFQATVDQLIQDKELIIKKLQETVLQRDCLKRRLQESQSEKVRICSLLRFKESELGEQEELMREQHYRLNQAVYSVKSLQAQMIQIEEQNQRITISLQRKNQQDKREKDTLQQDLARSKDLLKQAHQTLSELQAQAHEEKNSYLGEISKLKETVDNQKLEMSMYLEGFNKRLNMTQQKALQLQDQLFYERQLRCRLQKNLRDLHNQRRDLESVRTRINRSASEQMEKINELIQEMPCVRN